MRCSVVTLLHTPHSHMHTPPQEDKCRLLPQPKPVPTEGGEEEGEGEEPVLNKMADQWMSTRDLMKVCVCVCACICPIKLTLCPLTPPPGECLSRETSAYLNELYCVSVQKVTAGDQTWSVSCPSCPCSLCSPLVSTSSPPTTATNMWTYLTRSALLCVVLGVSTHMFVVGIVRVCGGQCTCVCLHTCTYVYVLLLYTYLQY